MQIDPKAIKNIIAIRDDRFGEFLLNIPAFRALKETFSNAKLIVVTTPYVRELARGIPFINEVIIWERGRYPLITKLRLIKLLKRKHIDIAVMLNPSKEFNIITYLSGIPVRAGYDRKWGFLLTHKIKDLKYLANRHEVEYNLELVNLIGAKTQDKSLALTAGDNLIGDFNINIEKNSLIAVHPWTSDPVKQWPKENFRRLTEKLSEIPNMKVAIVGGKENQREGMELCGNMNDRVVNLVGKTTLLQLASLLKKCRLLISGDSGPVHLAACVATPVIAIFRNDIPGKTPGRWGPWGEGHTIIEKSNLAEISVEDVFTKIQERLNR